MEQESIFEEIPTEKLFKPLGIYIATFFGGPIVAGYLISCNYKSLNEKHNVVKTWVFTIIGTMLILFYIYAFSNKSSRHLPGFLFPLIYTIITYNVVNLVQKRKIAAYISSGGQFHPPSGIIIVVIVGLVITFFGLLIIGNIFDWFDQMGITY